MLLTNDQYLGLAKLQKWWNKYSHQFIEVSGCVGTGTFDLVEAFIDSTELNPYEVVYLSYNQKEVLSLAYQKKHSFYINDILYKYIRFVDFDSIPVINPKSTELVYQYKKQLRRKINPNYKLMVVFDSTLLSFQTLKDLASFGLPVILIRDPYLIPSPDSHSFLSEPNIILNDLSTLHSRDPLIYIARKTLQNPNISIGSYDKVTVLNRKQLNLYNLKSMDMILTLTDALSDDINRIYREKILKQKGVVNCAGERLIAMESLYKRILVNPDNEKVKVFLTAGMVGYISRIVRHNPLTKYVDFDFHPECYQESFANIILDRHYLNNFIAKSYQTKPDEIGYFKYAYALNTSLARLGHWDKVLLILEQEVDMDYELKNRLIYTAITRAKESLLIAI